MSKLFTLKDYIEHKGSVAVARELGVDEQTVYYWKKLETAPRPKHAAKLIALTNGLLTWEGVYKPFVEKDENPEQLSFDLE